MLTATKVHLHPAGAGDLCPPPAPPPGPLPPRPACTHPRSAARADSSLVTKQCLQRLLPRLIPRLLLLRLLPRLLWRPGVPCAWSGWGGGAGWGRGAAATSTAGAAPRPPSPGSRSAPCAEPRPPASCRAGTTRDSRNCVVVSYHIYNLDICNRTPSRVIARLFIWKWKC